MASPSNASPAARNTPDTDEGFVGPDQIWLLVLIALVGVVLLGAPFSPQAGWLNAAERQEAAAWLGLPGGLFLAAIVTQIGVPPQGVALILGVDRLLDMCRTAVNVASDLTACLLLGRRQAVVTPTPSPDRIRETPQPQGVK